MRLLVIPDIHHNIDFVKRIFKKETDFDHVIFLGDWFDSKKSPPEIVGVKEVCQTMVFLDNELKDRATWLMGNHDLPYAWAYPFAKVYKYKSYKNPFSCSGHTENRAGEIAKNLPEGFFDKFKMAEYREGVLFSHAGVHPSFVPKLNNLYDVEFFVKQANETLCHFRSRVGAELFEAGYARGGKNYVGGPNWLDWHDEFIEDVDMPPQVVGHTSGNSPKSKGKSWCIDGKQNWYAVINKGTIELKVADNEKWEKEKKDSEKHICGHFKANI